MKIKIIAIFLAVFLVLSYCLFVFSPIPGLRQLRSSYIQTAMSTLSHQWLATAFLPKAIVEEVMRQVDQARQEQLGSTSTWESAPTLPCQADSEEAFYQLFPQLDRESFAQYLQLHPELLTNGWGKLYVNQSGLKENGLPLYTTAGDQVLAIDAENAVLLLRVRGTLFQGVLAICGDPSRLSLVPAPDGANLIGDIAASAGGVLAITASGFEERADTLVGWAVYDGVLQEGKQAPWHKRAELRSDCRLYITDALTPLAEDTRYAMEFSPALLIDGQSQITDDSDFSAIHPRVCLGQDESGRVLMLAIQGRSLESIGATASDCVSILSRYGCRQAMSMDGGNSAMLYYRGQYLLEGASSAFPLGRETVNAWVYGAAN